MTSSLLETPSEVLSILQKLDPADQELVQSYLDQLKTEIQNLSPATTTREVPEDAMDAEKEEEKEPEASNEPDFPPLYESGEDYEKASDLKQEASELKDAGDWEGALLKYNEAIMAAPPSALLYANRATALLQLGRPRAAVRDCDAALQENPDSAKALRVRGKARKELGMWEAALQDLSASQAIDFDEGTVDDLKFLAEKHLEMEKEEAEKRIKEEERLRKRAEEIKKAQEDAKREAQEEARQSRGAGAGGFPGGAGFPGAGMPGMPDMSGLMGSLMSDPELVAAMQNPKVQAAFQELMSGPGGPAALMSNPAKLQKMMSDPEVGPVLQKFMAKMMGGGMGGMGAGGGMSEDGVPNVDDMGDLDLDDMPDLEPSK